MCTANISVSRACCHAVNLFILHTQLSLLHFLMNQKCPVRAQSRQSKDAFLSEKEMLEKLKGVRSSTNWPILKKQLSKGGHKQLCYKIKLDMLFLEINLTHSKHSRVYCLSEKEMLAKFTEALFLQKEHTMKNLISKVYQCIDANCISDLCPDDDVF